VLLQSLIPRIKCMAGKERARIFVHHHPNHRISVRQLRACTRAWCVHNKAAKCRCSRIQFVIDKTSGKVSGTCRTRRCTVSDRNSRKQAGAKQLPAADGFHRCF
jgi:hypothetical protein